MGPDSAQHGTYSYSTTAGTWTATTPYYSTMHGCMLNYIPVLQLYTPLQRTTRPGVSGLSEALHLHHAVPAAARLPLMVSPSEQRMDS